MAKEIKMQAGILTAGAVLFIAAVIVSGRAMLENEVRFFLFLAVYLLSRSTPFTVSAAVLSRRSWRRSICSW